MAQHTNTAQPHASKQIAPYPTRECGPTARIASKRIPRECDADLTSFPPALSLKAQTQAARSILHRPPGRAATQFSSRVVGGLVASHQPSCQGGRQRRERQPQAGVTGVERHATNCSGPAHGEHPVVNGKAGVLSAQGSTPPSSTNSSQQTSPSQQGEKP